MRKRLVLLAGCGVVFLSVSVRGAERNPPSVQAAATEPGTDESSDNAEDGRASTGTAAEAGGASGDENAALLKRIAALESAVEALTEAKEANELEALVAEAEAEAKAPEEGEKPEERTFLWGALALQKLNPEISLSADMLAALVIDEDFNFYNDETDRSRIGIREVGLQIQHVLDPYSMFKTAINFIPEPDPEVEVEEVYITWFGIIPSLSLSVGRFRQNFGVVNRWHGHDLDQTDYPLALSAVLGEGGLNQTGFSIKWFMPAVFADANELTLEVTNAENETLFAGAFFSVPSAMLHLKNYYDLTDNTYLELGLSGLYGTNNKRGYVDGDGALANESLRNTVAAGADLTLQWSPLERAKYRGVTWRTEGFWVYKETAADDLAVTTGWGEADGERMSFGAYSYLDVRINPWWIVGIRGDVTLPTIRTSDEIAWDVVPYVTFWQSEFVYLRLEYQYGAEIPFRRSDDTIGRLTDNRVLLQIDFAAGPHKHEKY